MIKKSNFVKEDKTIVRSTHPPLKTVLITCQKTEVKASFFKIADNQTPIISLIEQNNFTNESLHIFGQQLGRIKEKIDEKTLVSKLEKPLIDLSSQREKVNFKTSQAKTLDSFEKMLSDLKVKTEGTSTSAARTISRNEKEIVSIEKPVSIKTEEPLINLPSQDKKFKFKTSQSKTLEIVEKMLYDLNLKLKVLLEV